jgi:hypothetical protein
LIRSKVWFPNIDQLVENKLKSCIACQATSSSGANFAPIQMSEMPTRPWSKLSADFFGEIYPSKDKLLVILDNYSDFPLVDVMQKATSQTVINKFRFYFNIFGIPDGDEFNLCTASFDKFFIVI